MFLINSFLSSSFFLLPFPSRPSSAAASFDHLCRKNKGRTMHGDLSRYQDNNKDEWKRKRKRKGKVFVKGLDILNIVEEKRLTLRLQSPRKRVHGNSAIVLQYPSFSQRSSQFSGGERGKWVSLLDIPSCSTSRRSERKCNIPICWLKILSKVFSYIFCRCLCVTLRTLVEWCEKKRQWPMVKEMHCSSLSTHVRSGRTIFLLAEAAGVDLDFSIAIR